MLNICSDHLPQTEVTYIAFRVACCETLERIGLAEQMSLGTDQPFGFLTEVPFLKSVPPQVQVDLLAETWSRHCRRDELPATLVDESVVYAVCETSARLVLSDPGTVRRYLASGPRKVLTQVDERLAAAIQALHLELANEGDFLLISQFQDIPPDEAGPLKETFGLSAAACEPMFEALGRWHVSARFSLHAAALLTGDEVAHAVDLFRLRRPSRSLSQS
jgi:hypothetical protein